MGKNLRNTKILGNALKEVRLKKEMDRDELSLITGLSWKTIQNVERGVNMSSKSLEVIFEALGIKACDFYV